MAVTVNKTIRSYYNNGQLVHEREYKGLSTDTRPSDCAVNSLFLELDTGNVYYYDGSAWQTVGA